MPLAPASSEEEVVSNTMINTHYKLLYSVAEGDKYIVNKGCCNEKADKTVNVSGCSPANDDIVGTIAKATLLEPGDRRR